MLYRLFLKNLIPSGPDWGDGDAYVVGTYLQQFFNDVCREKSTLFSSTDVTWNPNPCDVRPKDLLIYFVDSHASSLIRRTSPGAGLGRGGTTRLHPLGNLSEVYRSALPANDQNPARGLATLAFHEAMHNKLKMGSALHGLGGGGMAGEPVSSSTPLTDQNRVVMAEALENIVRQDVCGL